MAPEAMDSHTYSEASDVYAFGMIVWQMFTRHIPFHEIDNPHQVAVAVLDQDARPAIPEYIPPAVAELIQACWTRNTSARPRMEAIMKQLAVIEANGLPSTVLSTDNAALYVKKQRVHAFRCMNPVIVYKSWGIGESKKGDWIIVGPGDDVYTCDHKVFEETYEVVPGDDPHYYRKFTKVLAKKQPKAYLVITLEGLEHGAAGSYLAQNPVRGEQYPIAQETFERMYERSEVQALEGLQARQLEEFLYRRENGIDSTKIVESKEEVETKESEPDLRQLGQEWQRQVQHHTGTKLQEKRAGGRGMQPMEMEGPRGKSS
jgi:hypothetical protein